MLLGEIIQKVGNLRETIVQDVVNSREKSLVLTKLDEAELWLGRCMPTELQKKEG